MQGSHFHLPIYRMPVATFCRRGKKSNLPILATTLSKDSKDYHELSPLENFALVMGNEGQGISSVMAESADQLVHIWHERSSRKSQRGSCRGILMFYFLANL